jgi:cytoskeletal protein CcmA (bactofilin family)
MLGSSKKPLIKSLVAQGTRVGGSIGYQEGLRIDGDVLGDVFANEDSPSILVISESASVTGQVKADHIIINGTVKGPVLARQMLELQPKARIVGDVSYRTLEMHQGALIAGVLKPLSLDEVDKPTLKLESKNGLPTGGQVFH